MCVCVCVYERECLYPACVTRLTSYDMYYVNVQVQRLFVDHSHMGALRKDINQLRHLLDALGFDWSFEEVKCAFNKMDSNYNDEVDFREFYKW